MRRSVANDGTVIACRSRAWPKARPKAQLRVRPRAPTQGPTTNGEARWRAAAATSTAATPRPARARRGWLARFGGGPGRELPRSAFGFLVQFGLPQQILLLSLTAASLPVYYASLDLPKQIVDKALGGKPSAFPRTVTFGGIDFGSYPQLQFLAFLCGLFLLTVLINGGFKYAINVYKGRLGEGLLRLLRSELLSRVLRFPLSHFRKISQGELIAMVTGEVEALGGYFGDAIVTPAFQGGLLITALGFIFAQDLTMGLAAVALYPPQAWLIPKLQRRVNRLGYARVREVRHLSQRIGEVTSVIEAVHVNYADQLQLDSFSGHLKRILDIRYDIYKKKFFIKFLNNFIAQLTPFFFLSIGGYLVLRGHLTLGSLVGVLAAYKDLAPPWKELLDFYQGQQDARIKYDQLIAQFDPGGLRPPFAVRARGGRAVRPRHRDQRPDRDPGPRARGGRAGRRRAAVGLDPGRPACRAGRRRRRRRPSARARARQAGSAEPRPAAARRPGPGPAAARALHPRRRVRRRAGAPGPGYGRRQSAPDARARPRDRDHRLGAGGDRAGRARRRPVPLRPARGDRPGPASGPGRGDPRRPRAGARAARHRRQRRPRRAVRARALPRQRDHRREPLVRRALDRRARRPGARHPSLRPPDPARDRARGRR